MYSTCAERYYDIIDLYINVGYTYRKLTLHRKASSLTIG